MLKCPKLRFWFWTDSNYTVQNIVVFRIEQFCRRRAHGHLHVYGVDFLFWVSVSSKPRLWSRFSFFFCGLFFSSDYFYRHATCRPKTIDCQTWLDIIYYKNLERKVHPYGWLSSVRFKYKPGYRPCDLL